MKWFLYALFLYGIRTIYSNSIKKNMLPDELNSDVNVFLGKILQADKFDELAERIADRAVKKLNEFQNVQISTTTGKSTVIDEGVYRSQTDTSGKSRKQNKHKHGEIDVEAVLKTAAPPLGGLKLKYKNLKKIHDKGASHWTEKESENAEPKEENEKNKKYEIKFEYKPKDNKKNAQDLQFDFHENIKTLGDEKFVNPFGDEETILWDEKASMDTSIKDTNAEQVSGSTAVEDDQNLSRTTRIEGDKQFISEYHADYKEYNEELAKLENTTNVAEQ